MPKVPERELSRGEILEAERLAKRPRNDSRRFRQVKPQRESIGYGNREQYTDVLPQEYLHLKSDPFESEE